MKQYLEMAETVLKKGSYKYDRTKVGTISYFGYQMRFNLNDGFPLLTTKKVFFKAIVHELIWFISGSTNIKYLVDNNINIWNDWPYKNFKNSKYYKNETMSEFIEKIKNNPIFAEKFGDLGPVYGKQWRNFNGVDQLKELISNIKTNPNSRRLILNAWNVGEIKKMALPPCHLLCQFYVNSNNELSCQLYQRSADIFLGVPFNIASYALLTMMIAKECNLKLGEFIHTLGDCHIYTNHIDQIKSQLKREPKSLSSIILNPNIKSIFDYKFNDIKLFNYESHPRIQASIAV